MRESPALGIIEKLQSLGADAQFHDPTSKRSTSKETAVVCVESG